MNDRQSLPFLVRIPVYSHGSSVPEFCCLIPLVLTPDFGSVGGSYLDWSSVVPYHSLDWFYSETGRCVFNV